jgi:hypothetical protein
MHLRFGRPRRLFATVRSMWRWNSANAIMGILTAGYTGPLIIAARCVGEHGEPGAVILVGRGMTIEEKMRTVRVRHELLPDEADDLADQLRAMARASRSRK